MFGRGFYQGKLKRLFVLVNILMIIPLIIGIIMEKVKEIKYLLLENLLKMLTVGIVLIMVTIFALIVIHSITTY